jgi:uncharacterized protein
MLSMQYRRFGRTELSMPVFSCGGMRYQQQWQDCAPAQIQKENQENIEATIYRALELGINHIETARGYGTSEMQLGHVLPKLPREKLIIQTKVSPTKNAKDFVATFNQSMKYLNLEYVDLLGLHGINTPELLEFSLGPSGCVAAARQLVKEGRVRHIGFSTHAPTNVIIKAIDTGLFDYVNLHWYYINQRNWPAIEHATQQDMGVFIISPSDKGGKLYDPPHRLMDLCQPLSPMAFNDLFCLNHPQVHTLSLGASRPGDFDEHLKVLSLLDQADAILPSIITRLEQAMIDVLGESWVKTWEQGLPSHEQTPGNINIPILLWLRNLALAYDLVEYGKMRYNLLGNGGHWFPGRNAVKLQELDLTECLARSPHREVIPQFLAETHALLGASEVKRLSQE